MSWWGWLLIVICGIGEIVVIALISRKVSGKALDKKPKITSTKTTLVTREDVEKGIFPVLTGDILCKGGRFYSYSPPTTVSEVKTILSNIYSLLYKANTDTFTYYSTSGYYDGGEILNFLIGKGFVTCKYFSFPTEYDKYGLLVEYGLQGYIGSLTEKGKDYIREEISKIEQQIIEKSNSVLRPTSKDTFLNL